MNLDAFFADYERRTNAALADPAALDVEASAAAFAECFIGSTPAGIMVGQNDDELRAFLPKHMDFCRQVGTQSMTIGSIAVTPLDALHATARVHWIARYKRPFDGAAVSIEFDVIYLVRKVGDDPKIFGWISGDEFAALKAHGLLPA